MNISAAPLVRTALSPSKKSSPAITCWLSRKMIPLPNRGHARFCRPFTIRLPMIKAAIGRR